MGWEQFLELSPECPCASEVFSHGSHRPFLSYLQTRMIELFWEVLCDSVRSHLPKHPSCPQHSTSCDLGCNRSILAWSPPSTLRPPELLFLWGWRQGLRSSPQSTSSPAVFISTASTGTRRPQINYVTSFSISAQNHTWRTGNLEGFCCLKSIGEGEQGGKREDTIARFTREGNNGKYSKSHLLHFSK